MVAPRGYQRTSSGTFPEGWQVATLGSIFSISAGGDAQPALSSSQRDAVHPFPIYSNGITNGGLYGYSSRAVNPADSLTVTARGTLGVATYRDHPYTAIGRVLVLKAKQECDARFFAEFINNRVKFAVESTGVPQLTAPQISQYSVAVPPIAEQRAIAATLGDVDRLLVSIDQLVAKKHDLRRTAKQQLLTARARLHGFTEPWKLRSLGDLFEFSGGYPAARDRLSQNGYCYLHYGDIHKTSKTFIDVGNEFSAIPKLNVGLEDIATNSLLKDGDVVFVDASEDTEGASEHVVIVNKTNLPFISGLHTIVAKAKADELVHEYRRFCFQSAEFRNQVRFYAVGMKVFGLSKRNITKLTIVVPPTGEQRAIANILSDMDSEITLLEVEREKMLGVKVAMTQQLLTGKTRLAALDLAHA
jgi:type I restriction enzyme, S subunit